MNHKTVNGWVLLSLLMSTLVYAYPQPQPTPSHIAGQYIPKTAQQQAEHQHYQYLQQQQPQPRVQHYQVPSQYHQQLQLHQQQQQQQQQQEQIRKFAEKQNPLKKVSLDDIDTDTQTNQIDGTNFFSWTTMISSLMQLFANQNLLAPTKSDDSDGNGIPASPWTNVIATGLKIFTTLLGGGGGNDGIDKVDNGSQTPMQSILAVVLQGVLGGKDPDQVNTMAKQAGEFINIVVNLLDALKTSFSHRSIAARSNGKKDSVSDLGIASITMLKGYIKTTGSSSEKCMQKYMCEANTECSNDIGGNSILCQMGNYATSFVLERTSGSAFEKFYDAGRHGRQGQNCRELYLECNE